MKYLPLREMMKTKNFYLVVFFFFMVLTTLWCVYNPGSNIQTVVSNTQRQISNIKKIPETIRQMEVLKVDPAYLAQLGFIENEFPVKKESSVQTSLPVVASGISSDRFLEAKDFIRSVRKYLPHHYLILFDLGLGSQYGTMLRDRCNDTGHCEVRKFQYDDYPSHVRDLELYSYRPICIQEVLNEYGAVIWADTSEFFISGNVNGTLKLAETEGIAAWTIKDSTSSLTHPRMFKYFETKPDNYYFNRAVEASHLVLYNSEKMHQKLMLPWVKCALMEDCISPIGAQSNGCNFHRKPLFLYTGCHRYDMSALNVILGQIFQSVEKYASNDILFGYHNPSRRNGNKSAPNYVSRLQPLGITDQQLMKMSIQLN